VRPPLERSPSSMSSAAEQPQPLTDIEYKLLLVAYIHTQPDDALNKGRIISTLFASAGPVGNNPASMPQLLSELKVDNVSQIESAVNDFALNAKKDFIIALKRTRTSIINALPPDFPAGSREESDIAVKPVLSSIAKKVQAMQAAAKEAPPPPVKAGEEPLGPVPAPLVRAMIWQPPIVFTHAQKLGRDTSRNLTMLFDGDLVFGAGMLMYRIRVEDRQVRVTHYEMYGELRVNEDATYPIGQRIVIGRGSKADHQRPDQDADMSSRGLSRLHAAVTVSMSEQLNMLMFELVDLGSTNGTPVWWNDPQGAPPVAMQSRQVLDNAHGRSLATPIAGGEAWLSAGSMLYRVTIDGGVMEISHHGTNLQGLAPIAPRLHSVGTALTIGRDPALAHPVDAEHPGATGLSRKHVTLNVQDFGGGKLHLRVDDHSSNGTTVWWNPPPSA